MKLYIIVRRDLPRNVQSVQAIHAAIRVAYSAGTELLGQGDAAWGPYGPHVILLECQDRAELSRIHERLPGSVAFYEPDLNDQMTAIALYGTMPHQDGLKLLS